jgi:hypothetical protein
MRRWGLLLVGFGLGLLAGRRWVTHSAMQEAEQVVENSGVVDRSADITAPPPEQRMVDAGQVHWEPLT